MKLIFTNPLHAKHETGLAASTDFQVAAATMHASRRANQTESNQWPSTQQQLTLA